MAEKWPRACRIPIHTRVSRAGSPRRATYVYVYAGMLRSSCVFIFSFLRFVLLFSSGCTHLFPGHARVETWISSRLLPFPSPGDRYTPRSTPALNTNPTNAPRTRTCSQSDGGSVEYEGPPPSTFVLYSRQTSCVSTIGNRVIVLCYRLFDPRSVAGPVLQTVGERLNHCCFVARFLIDLLQNQSIKRLIYDNMRINEFIYSICSCQ